MPPKYGPPGLMSQIFKNMIFPKKLEKGDKIAIISPASVVKPEYIDRACKWMKAYGLEPVVMPHAKGPADGSYAASLQNRLDDLLAAWQMPDVRAVICARGGYGAVHLLPHIPMNLFRENPRWLIGFSDISALHALSAEQGVVSMHAPMTKDLFLGNFCAEIVMSILTNENRPVYDLERTETVINKEKIIRGEYFMEDHPDGYPDNQPGEASGILLGGNLAVIDGLAATPFDMPGRALKEDVILFIEDVAEPIYKTERILYRLYLQGVLNRIKGLIVGQFTESSPSANHPDTATMISRFLAGHGLTHLPVAYNFPAGHILTNHPLLLGAPARLTTTPTHTTLSFR